MNQVLFFMPESIRLGEKERKKEEVVTYARVRSERIINLTVFSLCPLLFYIWKRVCNALLLA